MGEGVWVEVPTGASEGEADLDLPVDLVDALWYIHEMSTPAGMESLLSAADQAGVALPNDRLAPADIATRVWVADPDLLRRCHSELSVMRRRSFETFVPAKGTTLAWVPPGPEKIAAFDAAVASWYVANRRGRGARVLFFDHGDELRFLVRHGGPYRREGSLDEGEPGCVRESVSEAARQLRTPRSTLEYAVNSLRERFEKADVDQYFS